MLVFATTAQARETCWAEGPSQFADAIHYCVSSVLRPQGKWSYGPKNLVGYYGSEGAWCEGVKGPGRGEAITIRIDRGAAFRRLLIRNGYGKSTRSFADNGRIKRARITTDTGVDATVQLVDQPGEQPVNLPLSAPHRWVRLEILEVYPGARYADTCVSAIGPDFEYEERLLQNQRPPASKAAPTFSAPSLPDSASREVSPPRPPARDSGNALEELPALPRTESELMQDQRPQAGDCLTSGEPVSGRLELREATHPAGYHMKSYHLLLSSPVCVNADDERIDAASVLQLVLNAEQRSELNDKIGDRITVRGTFVAPHTAWHTGDIVLVEVTVD